MGLRKPIQAPRKPRLLESYTRLLNNKNSNRESYIRNLTSLERAVSEKLQGIQDISLIRSHRTLHRKINKQSKSPISHATVN